MGLGFRTVPRRWIKGKTPSVEGRIRGPELWVSEGQRVQGLVEKPEVGPGAECMK